MKYSYQENEKRHNANGQKEKIPIAKAMIKGANASYKDLCEVCRNVRGKDTLASIEFLSEAYEKKQAIYFARHCKGKGHRRELGGKKGGWPVKSIKIVLDLVKSAYANANRLGLNDTKIAHILANKQHRFPRMSPKGRRIRHDYETAFVEVVLTENIKEKKSNAKKSIEEKNTKKVENEKAQTEEKIPQALEKKIKE